MKIHSSVTVLGGVFGGAVVGMSGAHSAMTFERDVAIDESDGTIYFEARGYSTDPEAHAWFGWAAVSARIIAPAPIDHTVADLPNPGEDIEFYDVNYNCQMLIYFAMDVEALSGSGWFTVVPVYSLSVNPCNS